MFNTKIMVNFEEQHVINTTSHEGSEEFKSLKKKGYVKVGTVKGKVPIYWEETYFNPKDKYHKPNVKAQ